MKNTCRTCLRVSDNLLSLNDNKEFIFKIEAISSIQLTQDDNYPTSICNECAINIKNYFNFRTVIINSDKELRELNDKIQKDKVKPISINEIKLQNKETDHHITVKNESDYDNLSISISCETDSSCDLPENALLKSVKKVDGTMKTCKVCNDVFPSRYKLYQHMRTKHVAIGVCNICGTSIRKDNLSKHVRMHSEGPVSCEICRKVVKNSQSLRVHMMKHRGDIFTCEICGKFSKVKSEHTVHMKTHLDPDISKAKCKVCDKKVRRLRIHMRTHTGERPYLCHYCSKGFISSHALKVHIRQHTNEKPYACDLCPMAFPQKISLDCHLKSKHNVCK